VNDLVYVVYNLKEQTNLLSRYIDCDDQ